MAKKKKSKKKIETCRDFFDIPDIDYGFKKTRPGCDVDISRVKLIKLKTIEQGNISFRMCMNCAYTSKLELCKS